jgi:cell shape-determining protein MreC
MYQFRDKKKYKYKNKIIRNIIIGIVVFLLFILGIIFKSGNFFHLFALPFWKTEKSFSEKIPDPSILVRTKLSVFSENESLKNKIADLEMQMTDFQLLKIENEELKNLFFRIPSKSDFILGVILTKPNRSPYDTIVIDIGENVGLMGGEQVFANAEVPIGEITEVHPKDSLVSLYSNPGRKTEGVMTGTNATVELIGRGGGNFEMIIPLDMESEKGTTIVLPNIESRIIAIIESVLSNPTDSIKKVLLRSPVNFQELKWVQVKKN